MILYKLHIRPGENDSEAEDFDEWFSSLRAAKRRRAAVIAESPCRSEMRWDGDYEIDRIMVARVPSVRLVLDVLNRRAWRSSTTTVVAQYEGRPCVMGDDGRCRHCDRIVDYDVLEGRREEFEPLEARRP